MFATNTGVYPPMYAVLATAGPAGQRVNLLPGCK